MEITNTILISILTYKSTDVIEKCLESLQNQSNKNFKCFIFDNNSGDNIEEILKKYDWVKLIKLKENSGYTGGHNFAFNYFKKNFPNHKYMMVLNPDIFLSKNLIHEFFSIFKIKEATLYTCPILEDLDGKNKLLILKNIHFPSFTFLGRNLTNIETQKNYLNTMFVLGSCFIVNLEKYSYDYLFRDYFMYHDEIELSVRTLLNGDEILCISHGNHKHFPKNEQVSAKVNYLLELNRLKFQIDTFNHVVILLNLPIYLLSRVLIILIYKPIAHYPMCFKGMHDGIKYFLRNAFKLKVSSFSKTINFIFIENSRYK